MNTNLLDLNNDVLNIIGDFVKKDNVNKIKRGDITFNEYVETSANLPVSMCLYGNLKSVCVRNGTSYTYTYRFSILCMYVHMCMYCMYVYVSEIHNILDTCTYIQIHTIHTHTYFNFETSRYIHIHTYTYL